MKEYERSQSRIVFDPCGGANSTATSQTPLGEYMIEFAQVGPRSELTLTLVEKPQLGWKGFLTTPLGR